jgi:hypothetical protein
MGRFPGGLQMRCSVLIGWVGLSGIAGALAVPGHPFPLGHAPEPDAFGGAAYSVAISGNYAYVANDLDGLRIYDISDPTNPTAVGHAPEPTEVLAAAEFVVVAGEYAYVANYEDGLRVYDVSDPTDPTSVFNVPEVEVGGIAWGVAVAGNYLYLANFEDGVRIYDLTDPAAPTEVSGAHLDTAGQAYALAVFENHLYVADGDGGLVIYDVSDPTQPDFVGQVVPPAGAAFAVAVGGNLAYVANGEDGLRIYDVSDPANPAERAHVGGSDDGFYVAYGVAVAGGFAFVASNEYGLEVYDVKDVNNVTLVGSLYEGGQALNVTVASGLVYVANGEDGLRIDGLVWGEHIFYNESAFDGNSAAANASDDGAIAPDKSPLLPGQAATFANYTSYSKGINGVMVDLPLVNGAIPGSADFTIKLGNDNNPGSWSAGPAPAVTVRTGAGGGGSDRVTLIWDNGVIKKQWLQVTVLANANTGLPDPEVFYFGNAIGECGDNPSNAQVNVTDVVRTRANQSLGTVPITSVYDYSRDGKVNVTDVILCRANQVLPLAALNLIKVP